MLKATGHRLTRLTAAVGRRRTAGFRARAVLAILVGLAILPGRAVMAAGSSPVLMPNQGLPPIIRHTGLPPTGYTVTFRYRDPGAKIVQIEGEWQFSVPQLTSPGSTTTWPARSWQPGDIPINPNASAEILAGLPSRWPDDDMQKDPATGIWSYTTPLPSGVFNYGYVVNCTHSELTPEELADPNTPPGFMGCPEIADPNNPPWNVLNGVVHGSVLSYSHVYVPSDPAFHTVDYSWEAPTSPSGMLVDITYAGPGGAPDSHGHNNLAIYRPPNYNPHRSTPYPTLYLSHGYDNNEVDWGDGGDAAHILDNLIDMGAVKPMVVVMTDAFWVAPPDPDPNEITAYDGSLLGSVVPFVQSHYDVSRDPSQRAFAGLSFGGVAAGQLLLEDTNEFGSFGLFSPAPFTVPPPGPAQIAAMKGVGVMVGGGLDDLANEFAQTDLANLEQGGGSVTTDFVDGAHDWFVWRVLLHDFLTRVAFQPRGG